MANLVVKSLIRPAVLSAALVFLTPPGQTRAAPPANDEPAAKVAAALDDIDAWVGDGAKGDRWRAYLMSDELRAALGEGAAADPSVPARTLARLRSDAPGLDLPRFASLRRALEGWVAQLRSSYADDLPRLAWASRGDHVPISQAQFEAARSELRRSASALLAALGPNSPLARGWQKYLLWDELEPHLDEGFQPTARSLAALDRAVARFRSNEPGLERPEFVAAAQAIARYRALASWAATARVRDARPVYERYLSDVQTALERHLERPTGETVRQLARLVGLVDGLGQSPELVQAVRTRFAQTNVFGLISAEFVRRMPQQASQSIEPVRDCILGTSIFGAANTFRDVRYELEPSYDTIVLAVFLTGEAHSQTRGFHKPVQINSRGRTTFSAVKRITISDSAFTSVAASATVDTRTQIQSIRKTGGQFGRRLVEKIAWQRAMEQKRQAELISASHTRDRILRDFDSIVARDLLSARGRYEAQIQAPLVRRGVSPEYLRMHSTPAGIMAETLFATHSQLGASGPPPAMMPGHDMALQIHESAINNYLPLALASARIAQETADVPAHLEGNLPPWIKTLSIGGPRVTQAAVAGAAAVQQAQEAISEIVGESEPTEKSPPPFKPYAITLNAEAPASVHFDEGQIVIRIRAAQLASDERQSTNWDFIVTYRITVDGDRIVLKRVGEIEVLPTGFDPQWPTRLSSEQTSFRSVLRRNMNDRANAGQGFPSEIPIEPVRFSRFGVMVLRELVAHDGWLTVGWGLP